MRRNHHKDEIERNLKALDGVEDTRSKEKIYRNIRLKMSESKPPVRRFRKPVVWGLSTAAVVVLTVIVVSQSPSPANHEEFGAESTAEREGENHSLDGEDGDEEEEQHEQEQEYEETVREEEDITEQEERQEGIPEEDMEPSDDHNGEGADQEQEEDGEEEDSIDRRVVEMDEVYADVHYRSAAAQSEQQLLTLPFLAPDDETIVTIAVDHSGEAEEDSATEVLDRIDPDELGLHASPLLDMGEQEDDEIIREGLEEIARFDNEEGWPAEWKERFQKEDADTEASAGYYVFQAEEGNAYLVSGNSLDMEEASGDNLEETLQRMETEEEGNVHSVIPPNVELENVDERDEESVLISYSGLDETIESDETQWLMFVEGVLLAAADFGYQGVEFDGDLGEIEQIGPYDLAETIDPPDAPNYIGEMEN